MSKIVKIRSKPVVKEAMQFKAGMTPEEITEFVKCDCSFSQAYGERCYHMTIETLEGEMEVSNGDWIIRGLRGEFYPCKPDVFSKSYEVLDEKA